MPDAQMVMPLSVVQVAGTFPPTIRGFYDFMLEREQVRIKASRGDPWPWTKDAVMQFTRFANVQREHDRTGILISRMLSLQASAWEKASGEGSTNTDSRDRLARDYVFSVAIWRRFGSAEFADRLGFVHCPESEISLDMLRDRILDVACSLWTDGFHACTDAYEPASQCHAIELAAWLRKPRSGLLAEGHEQLASALWQAESQGAPARKLRRMRRALASGCGARYVRAAYSCFLDEPSWPIRALWERSASLAAGLMSGSCTGQTWQGPSEALQNVEGYGRDYGAHAAEVIRDLFSTPLMIDYKQGAWAPVSSGARRCLARFVGRSDREGQALPARLLQEVREVYEKRRQHWPASILHQPVVELGLHDVQAQLGEFDRYLEACVGRPRRSTFFPRAGLPVGLEGASAGSSRVGSAGEGSSSGGRAA
mmetsp:Transcript_4569/g.12066  ORF Transcript_4569/g.12066 Transcript_4569/m.12066 type:complete len:425 (-) Transcript_4569:8-1282(-)